MSITLNILLSDIFELYGYKCDTKTFTDLIKFLSYRQHRVLFCKERKLYISKTLTIVRKDNTEYAMIDGILSKTYLKQDDDPFAGLDLDITDPLSISLQNKIPFSRITFEYDSLLDMPETYLERLKQYHSMLNEMIQYCIKEDILQIIPLTESKHTTYLTKIREFIANELN